MAEVRNAGKAKSQLQRKVEKLERKIKTLSPTEAAPQVTAAAGAAATTTIVPAPAPPNVLTPQKIHVNLDPPAKASPSALVGQKRVREPEGTSKLGMTANTEAVIVNSPFEANRPSVVVAAAASTINRTRFTPTRRLYAPLAQQQPRSTSSPLASRLVMTDENARPVSSPRHASHSLVN